MCGNGNRLGYEQRSTLTYSDGSSQDLLDSSCAMGDLERTSPAEPQQQVVVSGRLRM